MKKLRQLLPIASLAVIGYAGQAMLFSSSLAGGGPEADSCNCSVSSDCAGRNVCVLACALTDPWVGVCSPPIGTE
jgi:hypothetical protein